MKRMAWIWLPLLSLSAVAWWLTLHGSLASAEPAAAAGSTAPDGQVLYQEQCAVCHGAAGTGTVRAPSLMGVGEAAVDFELTTGRMPKKDAASRQPPYVAILPAADISALDQYVTQLAASGGPAIPSVDANAGDVSKGGELYDEYCAACHGWGGSGGILFDRPVPKVTQATPIQVSEAMRIGPDQMPVFGPRVIPDDQVNDIVAYLRQAKHPADVGGDPISHLGPVAEGAVIWLIGIVVLLLATRWIGERG